MMNIHTTTALLQHQLPAIAKMLPSRVGALFMDMGTGKTRCVIELAKIRQQKYDRLFWFCPVSLKETIRQQWCEHTDLADTDICVWDARIASHCLPLDACIHIIGIESMSASARTILAYNALVTDTSFVVVDESSYIKGHRSQRTERITELSARARYRLILTGTPLTQGPIDLYAQMKFLGTHILGYTSFYSFAANHLEYEYRLNAYGSKRRTGRILRAHNMDWLAAKIAPYVYQVKKDECLTLPPKLYESRYCPMSRAQTNAYQQAKEELLLNLDYEDWSPIAIFHLFTALQSIVCGFWNRTDPTTHLQMVHVYPQHRISLLLETLEQIPDNEPVIIWAKYHHAITAIQDALTAHYGDTSYRAFHGKLSEQERHQQLQQWQTGQGRFLIATQSAGGHGLTLNTAAYSIFYADGYKLSERLQAEDRNHRIGQTRRTTYITLGCSGSIDERIADALQRKENALAVFQRRINHYRTDHLKHQAMQLIQEL